jgi:polyribonucleotide nucleotidyltransferase
MNSSTWTKTQKDFCSKMEFKIKIGDEEIICKIENLAEQANGSCFLQIGESEVLSTAVISNYELKQDFFPLTVEYEERYYAAGKIRGPRYIKRETRPSDEAICNARLIDRAIRPLFPKELKREVQVINTVLSWDGKYDPDTLALFASSIALMISDIPWNGPLAVLRIGKIGDKFILNPTYEEREKASLDIVMSGVKREKILLNMIEARGQEAREEDVVEAFEFAKPFFEKLIEFQEEIRKKIGKEKIKIEEKKIDEDLKKEILENFGEKIKESVFGKEKKERIEAIGDLKEEIKNFVSQKFPEKIDEAMEIFEKERRRVLRETIIEKEIRPDGRKLDEIREISCQVGILPRTHGSGLFCRGQTKSLSIVTLGAPGDVQLLEGMEITGKKRFLHHYNFPPYCSGEIRPIKGPGRREIGHGVLVEKALLPLIPPFEQFPYTIRVVSEILSSNGSTSMAAVSSSSLALMDAGIPIKKAAAGISIGLITNEKGNYKILTDIQGPEDQLGDMDFKVAGTRDGITAIQMDVKIDGIDEKILKEALERAKKARLEILEKMEKVIKKPREELSPFAPRVLTLEINPNKIREVIGPGGSRINEIIEECGVSIDIEPDGKIYVTGEREEAAKKAVAWIKNITREIKVGEVFQGKVKRILNFGALVEIFPGQEGLIHISQLAPWRVKRVEDVVKVGEIVPVKVISIDELGRINLSLKAVKKFKKKNGKRS